LVIVIMLRIVYSFKIWLALACSLGLGACKRAGDSGPRSPGMTPFVVEVISVEPQPFQETLFATGTLLARESVILQAERAGVVREIRFSEGRPVNQGEVLLLLDDSELQAQLARAQAQLELSIAVENRQRELFKTDALISEAEYEQAQANLNIARAETELIKAQLAKTRIVAPFDGIPGLRQVSVGAYLTPGTPVASFQDISSLRLDFSLPERYLDYLRPGQETTFRVVGRTDLFEAVITAIEPAIDVATRSLQIRAVAINKGQQLLPGSFAEIQVVLNEIPEAILIPPIALIPGLKQQTVFVYEAGQAQERIVQTGLRLADAVQVLEGLAPGEELITSGILQMRPGMRVEAKRLPGFSRTERDATAAYELDGQPLPAGTFNGAQEKAGE
jgi:membrane fusion protein, multidrug efflux system